MVILEDYMIYDTGNIPLIISVPHGGTLKIKNIPIRTKGILGIDKETSLIIFVNGRAQNFDYKLMNGDQVGIFPPVGGG